jgi:hypothetical protein
MNGFGFFGTLLLVFLAVIVGIPLVATLGGLVVAVLAVGFALTLVVGILGALFAVFGLLFRISFGLAGVVATLAGGALMIGLAAAIASHLVPVLLVIGLIWFVLKQSKPQQPTTLVPAG